MNTMFRNCNLSFVHDRTLPQDLRKSEFLSEFFFRIKKQREIV